MDFLPPYIAQSAEQFFSELSNERLPPTFATPFQLSAMLIRITA
jgi:hypothetical protein